MEIRDAVEADLPAIVDIYNAAIPGGWSTADTTPVTVESRRAWFRAFDPRRRPIWVAESEGRIAGWVGLAPFYHDRPAYAATAEISVYVHPDFQRRGLGRELKRWAIAECPRLGITTLVSIHFDHNEATRRLNRELGFEEAGHLPAIAVVRGQLRGVILALRRIPPAPAG